MSRLRAVAMTLPPVERISSARMRPKPVEAPVMNQTLGALEFDMVERCVWNPVGLVGLPVVRGYLPLPPRTSVKYPE